MRSAPKIAVGAERTLAGGIVGEQYHCEMEAIIS